MFYRRVRSHLIIVALTLCLTACGGGGYSTVVVNPTAATGGPSTSLALTGLIATPATLSLAQLNALPQTSVTTNAQTATGTLGVHTYTGPLLYDLLESATPYANAALKNDLLRRGIVVTGSDGYQSAIAWGEIDPKFAGKKVLIATQQDGQPLPQSTGFARLIVPGDVFAGRFVSNVTAVTIEDSIAPQPQYAITPTASFVLSGLINTQGVYDITKLQSLPQSQVTITSSGVTHVYGGVLLYNLLSSAVLELNPARKNDELTKAIIAIGSDGYTSIVTAGEIDPKFGNIGVLVATSQDGVALPSTTGFARIVVPGDAAAGRYVSSLANIQVRQL